MNLHTELGQTKRIGEKWMRNPRCGQNLAEKIILGVQAGPFTNQYHTINLWWLDMGQSSLILPMSIFFFLEFEWSIRRRCSKACFWWPTIADGVVSLPLKCPEWNKKDIDGLLLDFVGLLLDAWVRFDDDRYDSGKQNCNVLSKSPTTWAILEDIDYEWVQ